MLVCSYDEALNAAVNTLDVFECPFCRSVEKDKLRFKSIASIFQTVSFYAQPLFGLY